jgi:hypothetical protein
MRGSVEDHETVYETRSIMNRAVVRLRMQLVIMILIRS